LIYRLKKGPGNSMADDDKMAEQSEQERYRQENEMAGGPVSRGASNKDAPMNQKQGRSSTSTTGNDTDKSQSPDYNKMIQQNTSGTAEGTTTQASSIPNPGRGTGKSRGGMGVSNSTVSSSSSSAGGLAGANSTRDRGSETNLDMDTSTNNATELTREACGEVPTRVAEKQPGTPPSGEAKKDE
jgi:hypothetical protein